MPDSLSRPQARRLALAAAGLTGPRPAAGPRGYAEVLGRLGQLQIDSVNVFERAHYLPLHSRIGRFERAGFDRWAESATLEYWPHQAGYIALEDWPLWAWRRAEFAAGHTGRWLAAHPEAAAWVRAELAAHGPATSRRVEADRPRSRGSWWDWSEAKHALERLWRTGEVVVRRRERFERVYELAETVTELPGEERPRAAAQRELVERAARALGVCSAADVADYWRISVREATGQLRALAEAGVLEPVRVEGWQRAERPIEAWRHVGVELPARVARDALLSPFDPLLWFRPRSERLFDFHYRIEIYTPAAQRRFGYYCLPVQLGASIAGRLDLKADRATRTLLVQSAWAEQHVPADAGERVRALLSEAARWQGLERIRVAPRGDLAAALPAEFEPLG